ncbi:MAG: hypothetical protein SWX82_14110 [Cyanobacteriota bacterium]|nr:hypothetical protein [Cyanobacteriota bacterium]
MRYAESILLGGQLIDAAKVDDKSYKELLCVCPNCKKEVFVEDSKKVTPRWGRIVPVGQIWKHSEDIEAIALDECREKNKYYETQAYILDGIASSQRLELLRRNLWELIFSSTVLNDAEILEYEDYEEDRLMMWFYQHFENLCNNSLYQAGIKHECENLYKNCIKKIIEDGNNHLVKKVAEIYRKKWV